MQRRRRHYPSIRTSREAFPRPRFPVQACPPRAYLVGRMITQRSRSRSWGTRLRRWTIVATSRGRRRIAPPDSLDAVNRRRMAHRHLALRRTPRPPRMLLLRHRSRPQWDCRRGRRLRRSALPVRCRRSYRAVLDIGRWYRLVRIETRCKWGRGCGDNRSRMCQDSPSRTCFATSRSRLEAAQAPCERWSQWLTSLAH